MRKIGKKEAAKNKRFSLLKDFQQNSSKCMKHGIIIAPECVLYNSKWRIVVEKREKDGSLKEFPQTSDPKFYYKVEDYEIKVMEITAFYAESF